MQTSPLVVACSAKGYLSHLKPQSSIVRPCCEKELNQKLIQNNNRRLVRDLSIVDRCCSLPFSTATTHNNQTFTYLKSTPLFVLV